MPSTLRLITPAVIKKASAPYFNMWFTLARTPGKDSVETLPGNYSCREGLVSTLAKEINNLPDDKTRLVWVFSSPNDKTTRAQTSSAPADLHAWMKRAKALANFYEKMGGWGLTTIDELNYPENDDITAYLFEGSRRWLKAPYLLSMYVLLTRIARNTEFSNFKTAEDIVKLAKMPNLKQDPYYGSRTAFAWEVVIRNYKDLFRQHKRAYYWDTKHLGSNANGLFREGIHILASGQSYNAELNKKFQEILEKGGLSHESASARR